MKTPASTRFRSHNIKNFIQKSITATILNEKNVIKKDRDENAEENKWKFHYNGNDVHIRY